MVGEGQEAGREDEVDALGVVAEGAVVVDLGEEEVPVGGGEGGLELVVVVAVKEC